MAQIINNLQNQARQQKGTGFTNLNKVIGVNQNNQLGQAVGSGINQQVNQGQQATQNAQQKFQTESEAGRLDTDVNKQKVQSTIADPTNVSDQDVNQFQTFRAGRYGGPQELQDQQRLQGQAQSTQSLANLGSSAGGRQSLLQRFVGGEGYSQGEQRLDNLLLGQSGNNQLREARRNAGGLVQDVNQATNAAGQRANLLSNQAQQFAGDVDKQIDTRRTGIDTDINTRIADTTALEGQRKSAFDALSQQINTGQLGSQEALQTLAGSNLLDDTQKRNLLDVYNQSLNSGVGADKALKDAMTFTEAQNINYQGLAKDPELQSMNNLRKLKNEFSEYDLANRGPAYQKSISDINKEKAQQNISANATDVGSILNQMRSTGIQSGDQANDYLNRLRQGGFSDDYIKAIAGPKLLEQESGNPNAWALTGGLQSAGLGVGQNGGSYLDSLNAEYQADLNRGYSPEQVGYTGGGGSGYTNASPEQLAANQARNQNQINQIQSVAQQQKAAYDTQAAQNQTALQSLMGTLGISDYQADANAPNLLKQNRDARLALLRNQAANAYTGIQGDANQKQSLLDIIKGITG